MSWQALSFDFDLDESVATAAEQHDLLAAIRYDEGEAVDRDAAVAAIAQTVRDHHLPTDADLAHALWRIDHTAFIAEPS